MVYSFWQQKAGLIQYTIKQQVCYARVVQLAAHGPHLAREAKLNFCNIVEMLTIIQ